MRLGVRDWFLIPFSLIWCGFAVFWEAMVLMSPRAPALFSIWGVPFILIGLYLVFDRLLADAWFRTRIRYALTDRRVLIARRQPFASMTALNLARVADVRLIAGRNGCGTIAFGPPVSLGSPHGFAGWMPALDPSPQFLHVADVQSVYALVQTRLAA